MLRTRSSPSTAWLAAAMVLLSAVLSGCEPSPPKPKAAMTAFPTGAVTTAPAAAPATLASLRALVGSYPGERTDYLRQGALAQRLQALLGEDYPVLLANLGTSGPLVQDGALLYISGNRPHEGGDEQAAVVVDPARNALRVWLVHSGSAQEWSDPLSVRLDWPRDVQIQQSNRQELMRNRS